MTRSASGSRPGVATVRVRRSTVRPRESMAAALAAVGRLPGRDRRGRRLGELRAGAGEVIARAVRFSRIEPQRGVDRPLELRGPVCEQLLVDLVLVHRAEVPVVDELVLAGHSQFDRLIELGRGLVEPAVDHDRALHAPDGAADRPGRPGARAAGRLACAGDRRGRPHRRIRRPAAIRGIAAAPADGLPPVRDAVLARYGFYRRRARAPTSRQMRSGSSLPIKCIRRPLPPCAR